MSGMGVGSAAGNEGGEKEAGGEAAAAGAGGGDTTAVDEAGSELARWVEQTAQGALGGAIAAMAMTGMRSFTVSIGLVEEPPPRAILRQKSKGLFRLLPKRYRRAGQELAHWGFGAAGGAVFALLPEKVRAHAWSGPVFGLAVWLGFEAGIAPVLGLSQAKKMRPVDRVTLAGDHLLYGLVLSATRPRPRA